jgi:hypothetical protein
MRIFSLFFADDAVGGKIFFFFYVVQKGILI